MSTRPIAMIGEQHLRKDSLLEVDSLSVTYRDRVGWVTVVEDVALRIDSGEILGLVGESGCGKSTIALAIAGLLPQHRARVAGRVVFEGRNLVGLSNRDMRTVRGNRIGVVFQDPSASLDPVFRVGEQITETVRAHRSMPAEEATSLAIRSLEDMGLPDPVRAMRSYPFQLSGGMRQRVMLAIALSLSPALLIADEPTTALDVTVQAQIMDLIRERRKELGLAVLLITHNLALAAEATDRIAVMYAGEIVEQGSTDELLRAPRHPYTQGLLDCLPDISRSQTGLTPIPGRVPDPRRYPLACRFQPRCPRALDICSEEKPALTVQDGADIRCWNPQPSPKG